MIAATPRGTRLTAAAAAMLQILTDVEPMGRHGGDQSSERGERIEAAARAAIAW